VPGPLIEVEFIEKDANSELMACGPARGVNGERRAPRAREQGQQRGRGLARIVLQCQSS
jgi:hypothetical protein